MTAPALNFSHETRLSDLAAQLKSLLRRAFPVIVGIFGGASAWLMLTNRPGALTFALLSAGAVIALGVWRTSGAGLPMLPMMAVQHLVAYGLPILVRHPVVQAYPAEIATEAGMELLLFLTAMSGGWYAAMHMAREGRPVAHALNLVITEGMDGLRRLGFQMIGAATVYQVLFSLGLLDPLLSLLPGGSFPIIFALASVITSCGLFFSSMLLASGNLTRGQALAFWCLLAINALILASGFLLSSVAIVLFSVAIGLFWGSGRIPWRFLVIVSAALAFLNLGKFEMRGLYWTNEEGEAVPASSGLVTMPERYAQWVEASWSILTDTVESTDKLWQANARQSPKKSGQSLLLRINNLQNILYVIDMTESGRVEPLGGKTYSIIPALLIPRILWPDKPRTHEGQVMLNVHFARQALESTFVTYVAWGLLAEAYGNFGSYIGSLIVGLTLGCLFGLLERKTSNKPLLSLEGFIVFIVYASVSGSFEMVASVLVTSTFQAVVPVAMIGSFFVRRITLTRT